MSGQPGVARYPNVFGPIRLGPVEVPNRIYMSPHCIALEAFTAELDSALPVDRWAASAARSR